MTFRLPTCRTEKEAEERRALLADLAGRLLAAGQIVIGLPLLKRAAARQGQALRDVIEAIDVLCRGDYRARVSPDITFGAFAEHYLSGGLAEQYPDHVRRVKSIDVYRSRVGYVLPILGKIPLVDFTLEHADYAMGQLPRHLEAGTRRVIASIIHRILSLAAYPAKIIKLSPLPRGWLPRNDTNKAKGYLYPDEEARLIANTSIDLCFRVFYGFLAREGMRSDEAKRLEWSNVDLERGAVRLDENKTDDPRAWALSPDVARALRIWRQLCPSKRHVFVNGRSRSMTKNNGAEQFRAHLQRAGIHRSELFEESATRLQIRLHDLRATFITIKLANGRTETWIADRTGHKSSDQINNYRRAARTVAELGLGDFAPMDETIPELRDHGKPTPPGGAAPADEGAGGAEGGGSENIGGAGVTGAGDGSGAEASDGGGVKASDADGAAEGGAADESGSAPTPAGPPPELPPELPEEEGRSAVAATAPRIPRASGLRWATAAEGSRDRDADPAWNTAVFGGQHRKPGKISRRDLGGGAKTLRVWRPDGRRSVFWGPPMRAPSRTHPPPPLAPLRQSGSLLDWASDL